MKTILVALSILILRSKDLTKITIYFVTLTKRVSSVLYRMSELVKLNRARKTSTLLDVLLVMKTTIPLVLVFPAVIMVGPKAVSVDDQFNNKRQLTNEYNS